MVAGLSQLPPIPPIECRAPGPGDIEALARLMLAAYRGTIDYEGEDEVQSLIEIRKTMAGEYGAFDGVCSRVIAAESGLVSAALLTRWRQRPFVAFSMTDRRFRRAGYARATLVSAMHALRAAGEVEVSLVVTLANEPAIALYRGLGFGRKVTPEPSIESSPVPHSDQQMHDYYASRAPEYDGVYLKPERQADLDAIRRWLPPLFAGKSVLEVACGTGYWTQYLGPVASGVLAVDASPETLSIARTRVRAGAVERGLVLRRRMKAPWPST